MLGLAIALSCTAYGERIVPSEWLAVSRVSSGGRSAVHVDAIEAKIVAGEWRAPKDGDTVDVASSDEPRQWTPVEPNEEGELSGRELYGGYAYTCIESDSDRVMILEASGHSVAYINGTPRAGDWYSTGWTMTPVHLRAGSNELLFRVARGRLRAKLTDPPADAFLNLRDPTTPDLIVGEKPDVHGVGTFATVKDVMDSNR